MKAARGSIPRALDRPDPKVRFYLFYGPDEAQSRSHADRLLAGLGAGKEVLQSGAIKSDPATLSDAAGAMSLFGETRAIWIEPAADEIAPGVEALLEAPAAANPTIAVAGALRKTSALLKLAESHPLALAHVSYAPDAEQAEAITEDIARSEGMRCEAGVAARIAEACGNDRRIIGQELRKLALYVGAGPGEPRTLGHEAVDSLGAEAAEGDSQRLGDLALAGELGELGEELSRLPSAGDEAIPALRALQRRLGSVITMRARMDRGESLDAAMASAGKTLFFKDKPLARTILRLWDSQGLARVMERTGALERSLLSRTPPPAGEALGEELIAIARTAARRR